mgnify:CR=1 FL=1
MAKGKFRSIPPGGGGMLKQIQKLQQDLLKTQEALAEETIEVSAGGGAITVIITGQQRIESVRIDPKAVDPEDVEMLQDLIVAAVNEALERSRELAAERLSSLTGGLNVPGLTF